MKWIWTEVAIAAGLFAGFQLVVAAGRVLGVRWRSEPDAGGQLGALQGAVLGLLGLLLAFSFAGSASRFIDRQDLVTQEANAIGTAALRAELLDEPHRSALRGALARYRSLRLDHFEASNAARAGQLAADTAHLHAAVWEAARAGVDAEPSLAVAVLGPVNEVIDLHATREMAARRHLPAPVFGLLVICSVIGLGAIGYGDGRAGGRHHILCTALGFLVAAALWITLDLDYPRRGLIQMSDAPLRSLSVE